MADDARRDHASKTAEGSSEEERFLARWSRRKQRHATEAHPAARQQPAPTESSAHATAPVPPAAPADLADPEAPVLPDIDSLDENSDYSAFLSPKVGEELQRLALRKLFGLPQFNIRDGLNDYDEDYTQFQPLGNIVTADMRHQMELAEQRRREREEEQRQLAERQAEAGQAPVGEGAEEPAEEGPPAQARAEAGSAPDAGATGADAEADRPG